MMRRHKASMWGDGGDVLGSVFTIPGSIIFSIAVVLIAWLMSSCGQTSPDDVESEKIGRAECIVARDPYEGKVRSLDCNWPEDPTTTVSTRP